MSGHSHAHNVKGKKDAEDKRKSKIFSKFSRQIMMIVREKNDPNPDTNSSLRGIMLKAKSSGMPKDTIENAIKKASGDGDKTSLEEVTYEIFGPGGIAMLAEGITDNSNRTFGSVKLILKNYNGKMASEGSVKWLFDRKGLITINTEGKDKEELELTIIEAGADDMVWNEDILEVYTEPTELDKVKTAMEEAGIELSSYSLTWKAKEPVEIDEEIKEKVNKLYEALEDDDDIQNIYSNEK
jgi:YebC/PmpR family DNA-binding regulatory protein